MSGVYIPDKRLPENCGECYMDQFLCLRGQSGVTLETMAMGRHRACPLIFVPDHGPLIDADELIAEHNGIFDNCCFPSDIRAAPVLIPADGEGEHENC